MRKRNENDMLGKRFGNLTVIEYAGNNTRQERLWRCKCDCGNEKIATTRRLTSQHTRSCGCLKKAEDLTGQRFGRLVVLKRLPNTYDNSGTSYVTWLCQCDCGNTKITTSSNLKTNNTTSCGCYLKEVAGKQSIKHGMRKTRLYSIYNTMKQRCNNPKNKSYKFYGGRGIKVCDEWNKSDGLAAFSIWALNNGYRDDLELDRIDSNGNYEPNNCRWITHKENTHNTRRNVYAEYKGEIKILADWSRELDIDHRVLSNEYKKGKTIEEIVFLFGNKRKTHEIPDNKACQMA